MGWRKLICGSRLPSQNKIDRGTCRVNWSHHVPRHFQNVPNPITPNRISRPQKDPNTTLHIRKYTTSVVSKWASWSTTTDNSILIFFFSHITTFLSSSYNWPSSFHQSLTSTHLPIFNHLHTYKTLMMMMMRVGPAAKAFAFARAVPVNRQNVVNLTALRMMSALSPPPVKVRNVKYAIWWGQIIMGRLCGPCSFVYLFSIPLFPVLYVDSNQ